MLHYSPGMALRPAARLDRRRLIEAAALLLAFTALRVVYACYAELRTDEAYYWTWSKENVLSFLDHPPMVAWWIRLGTGLFGDTNFGVRFGGLLGMAASQLLLADIVRRTTRDTRIVLLVLLMLDGTLYYGLLMSKVAPDTAAIPFALAMIWSLLRLAQTSDGRWWIAAGAFGGLALLSKYTVILFAPAILAFMLVPFWRGRWLKSPYPLLAIALALAILSPVLIWNAQHDWASFKFQLARASAQHSFSLRTLADFLGVQSGLVGPLLLPLVLCACGKTAYRGYRRGDPIAILLPSCVLVPFGYLFWRSLTLRIGDTWPMVIWPVGLAAVGLHLVLCRESSDGLRSADRLVRAAVASGGAIVVLVFSYYTIGTGTLLVRLDPIAKESGYSELAAQVRSEMGRIGATWIATANYRTYAELRWHFRDAIPVIQINERSRFLDFAPPDLARVTDRIGLYVGKSGDNADAIWSATTARLQLVGEIDRRWRDVVIERYELGRVEHWIPDLTPASDSPLYRWPDLGR